MVVEWGALEAYKEAVNVICTWFWQTYDSERLDKKFLGGLPLTERAHRFEFVEGKCVLVIISFRPGGPSLNTVEYEVYPQSIYAWLAEVEEEEIPSRLKLGDIAAMRSYPLPPPPRKRQRTGGAFIPPGVIQDRYAPDPELDEYMEELKLWTVNWAIDLAGEHMARTNPDFDQAQSRMLEAYRKLFQLENALRRFIEDTLQIHYKKDWWNQVLKALNTETVDYVRKRQAQQRHTWLDDFNTSRTRFLDFDHHRQIILSNGLFSQTVPDVKELTDLLRDLVPYRNRIGHVNTLSADNYEDFIRMSNRAIGIVQPHPEN